MEEKKTTPEDILKKYPCNRVLKGGKEFWGRYTMLKAMEEYAESARKEERESLRERKLSERYKENSMERALGFNSCYDIQNSLSGYSHLINAGDVVVVCKWLLKKGYDVISPLDKGKEEEK